jgi:hypothetical protein
LEGGRAAGVAGALTDVGYGSEQGGRGGRGGGERSNGKRRRAGRARRGQPADEKADREEGDTEKKEADGPFHLHGDAPERWIRTTLSWNRIRSGVKNDEISLDK